MSHGAGVDLELYRRFATAQGMRLHESESALWFEKRTFLFESVPPHRRVRLQPGESRRLFLSGAIILRYTCEEAEGSPSFEFICDQDNYGLHSLSTDARRRVRRGLDHCVVGPVDFDLLAREGCAINRSVFARHGRDTESFLTDESRWNGYMSFCRTLANVEAYGAFVGGRLCAFAFVVFVEDYAYFFHTHAHSDFLQYSPMNALFFSITSEMLRRPNVRCLSMGLEPLASRPDLERFKLAMGFRKSPIGRRILIHPLFRPVFSRSGAWIAERALRYAKRGLADEFSTLKQAVSRPPFGATQWTVR